MNVSPDVVMWVFGLVFVSMTGLGSIVWKMLLDRIKSIESRDREDVKDINRKMDSLIESINALKVDLAKNYVHREDCKQCSSN
jgi:hypothetical protein